MTPTLRRRTRGPGSRRGTTLLELAASALILGLVMAMVVQILGWALAVRREDERRSWALREAQNTLERALAADGERDVPPETAKRVSAALPEGQLELSTEDGKDSGSTRLTVVVRWKAAAGDGTESVRLVGWSFQATPAEDTR